MPDLPETQEPARAPDPAPAPTSPSAPLPAPPARRPVWMPAGGRGALWFWGGLSALLTAALVLSYREAASEQKLNRQLNEQSVILANERDKLRSQIDVLQTEVSQQGIQLKSSEQVVRQARETLQAVQVQTEQQDQAVQSLRKGEADLLAAIQKALPAVDGLPISVSAEGDRVLIRFPHPVLFDGNDTTLTTKGTDLLKKLAAVLKASPLAQEIAVEAFSEALPAGGKAPNPWDLTARRAVAAVRVLADGGVPDARLSARGGGAARPLAPNDGPDKLKNRRLEIAIKVSLPSAEAASPSPAP